ncbi:hypothetical protein ACY2BC_000212 [Listeria monocytogenes]
MSKLTSDEVEFKIKKLINLEKNLPKQIFSNPSKYNFYFEEPEAISLDTKEFVHMIKQVVEITRMRKHILVRFWKKVNFYKRAKLS